MTERVLHDRQLNRALLARQLLLKRSKVSLSAALERVGGLQTQYAPSGYIALWSRLEDFPREALTKALEQRRVAQATLIRTTIHMVSRRDFWPLAAGVRKSRREWWLRAHRKHVKGVDMGSVARLLRRRLAKGPVRATDLTELIRAEGLPPIVWSGAGLWVDMVRVPPSGTWEQRRADLYGLAETWLGSSPATEAEGIEHLIRRYLGGFGPASLKEVANWAGVPVRILRPVAEGMTLRRFQDEWGGKLLDLPRGPLPDADEPAPVRFLPTWDATLLTHARRTQILPEHFRARVFNTRTPHSVATFLVDGAVAGSWSYDGGRVRLDPFDRLPRASLRDLKEEGERLAAFHG